MLESWAGGLWQGECCDSGWVWGEALQEPALLCCGFKSKKTRLRIACYDQATLTFSMQLHSRGNVWEEAAMGKQHSTEAAEAAPWVSAHFVHSVALSTFLLKPLS